MASKWKSIRLLTPSKLRFLEHFRLDLASLAYFAPATMYGRRSSRSAEHPYNLSYKYPTQHDLHLRYKR